MRYRLRTLMIVLAIVPPTLAGFFMCRGNGDGFPKASRTAYDVKCLAILCETLDEEDFDFESVENLRELRAAVAARTKYGKSEWEGDYLLKTPYGNEYQYRFSKNQSGRIVTLFAEVPDYVPKYWKDKMVKQIKVRSKSEETSNKN